MVLFRANEEHLFKCMRFMNELRKNGTFCDISLIVGSQVLKAHRCVLAAGSEYFNVLFLGQFVEASMGEINLSEVTKDIDSLEMMVNYLYTGEIDINDDNMNTVAKLSSYFIMETVLKFLDQFIFDRLSLQTCLKYHLCAVEHGLANVIDQTSQMLTARFHDCLILEQETLDVSPDELMYLHQKDVFQFCTPSDLLKFVVDWVNIGITEHHISVGTEILDSISCIKENASLPLVHSREEALLAACEEMIATVNKANLAGSEEFVHRASTLRNQCIRNRDNKSKYNLRVLPTAKIPSTRTDVDKENVLITLFPQKSPAPNAKITFALCAYVPSMRCWYSVQMGGQGIDTIHDLAELTNEDSNSNDWEFTMRRDQIVLAYVRNPFDMSFRPIDADGNSITLHDLNGGIWEEYEFGDQVKRHLKANESWESNNFCFVTGPDNALYIIAVINCPNEENPLLIDILFRGFKFQESDKSWQISFQTKKYQLAALDFKWGGKTPLCARFSTVSNEMLVTYCDREIDSRSIIFVVNLSSETPVPVSILDSANLDSGAFGYKSVIIIQGKKQFFILDEIFLQYDVNERCFIEVKFEVKFNSNKLTTVETNKLEVGEMVEVIHPVYGPSNDLGMPWLVYSAASDQESAWYICCNHSSVSKLTEVTVSASGTPVIKSHPPPPFINITAAFAGTVSSDVLKKFKPVSFCGGRYSEKQLYDNDFGQE